MKISNRLIASLIKESLKRHLSEMSARFTPDRSDSSYYMTSPSLSKLNDNDFHPAAVHGAAELVAKTPRNPEGISAKGESAGLLQIADTSNALVSPDGSFYARIKANVYKSAFADRSANLDSSYCFSLNPMVNVLTGSFFFLFCSSCILATIRLESIPPDRNAPKGLSEIIFSSTDFDKAFSTLLRPKVLSLEFFNVSISL